MAQPNLRLGERTCVTAVELDESTPFFPGLDTYVSARVACLFDYHDDPDYLNATKQCSKYLLETPSDKVLLRAATGDLEAFLEVAMRYLSGCGMNKNPEGALYQLDVLTTPSHALYRGDDAPHSLRAKAHSCAAQAYLDKVFASPTERADLAEAERRFERPDSLRVGINTPSARITNFTHALHHANESAKLGLISPAVLHAGFLLRQFGETAGIDVSQITHSRRFSALWRAVTRRVDELYAEERIKQRKLAKDPNAYVCGADGCPMRAEERAAFRKCAGPCPRDLKPHYCSVACQKKDWLRHKAVCKPGSKGWVPGVTHQPKSVALELLGIEQPAEGAPSSGPSDAGPARTETGEHRPVPTALPPGPARTIDIPAPGTSRGYISVTSNTLESEMMKYIREEIIRQAQSGAAP